MKAISTKYYGPTLNKPAKVIARDADGNTNFVWYHEYESSDNAHRAAAEGLRDKMGWTGRLIAGGTKTGQVFVFAEDNSDELLGALKKSLQALESRDLSAIDGLYDSIPFAEMEAAIAKAEGRL